MQEVVDQRLRVALGKRLEQRRRDIQLAASPAGPAVEQLRPTDAQDHDRCATAPIGEVVHELEECFFGPVQVVEHHHEWARVRENLKQLPHGLKDLFARVNRRFRSTDRAGDDVEEPSRLRVALDDLDQLRVERELLDDLDEWEIRDPLSIGEAAPA